MLFSGRMSDISHLTEKTLDLDHVLQVICTEINEIKVIAQKLQAFVPDRKNYLSCLLFQIVLYFGTRGGISLYPNNDQQPHFIFPEMQANPSGIVTKIIRDIALGGEFDFLSDKSISKQFRYGAVQTIFLSSLWPPLVPVGAI